MYSLSLYDQTKVKIEDVSLPIFLSFPDKITAVNYAVRHIERTGGEVVDISDSGTVEFLSGSDTQFYIVNDIIDIRATQYAALVTLSSVKFRAQRLVMTAEELDDICSKLIYGFIDYAVVYPNRRAAVISALINAIKPALTNVTYADLLDSDTYSDVPTLINLLRPNITVILCATEKA